MRGRLCRSRLAQTARSESGAAAMRPRQAVRKRRRCETVVCEQCTRGGFCGKTARTCPSCTVARGWRGSATDLGARLVGECGLLGGGGEVVRLAAEGRGRAAGGGSGPGGGARAQTVLASLRNCARDPLPASPCAFSFGPRFAGRDWEVAAPLGPRFAGRGGAVRLGGPRFAGRAGGGGRGGCCCGCREVTQEVVGCRRRHTRGRGPWGALVQG